MSERGVTKQREGVVKTNRMAKTVVVELERIVLHARYKKYLRRRTKVKAHDETNRCQVGDRVVIVECRPLSREKRWRVSPGSEPSRRRRRRFAGSGRDGNHRV